MNQAIVTWDGTQFSWQSSLSPVDDGEIVIMSLEEGIFGDVNADDEHATTAIANFLTDSASDEGWRDVLAIIEQARADTDAWANSL